MDRACPLQRLQVAVCCSLLQCVAVCCSVLQCVAVCCGVLRCDIYYTTPMNEIYIYPKRHRQWIAHARCNVCRSPCVPVCCSVLQCAAVCCTVIYITRDLWTRSTQIQRDRNNASHTLVAMSVGRHVLQRVTVCCSVLQCAAVCCSVLQCVALWHILQDS